MKNASVDESVRANGPVTHWLKNLSRLSSLRAFGGLMLLFIISSILSPYFLTVSNIFNVLRQMSIIGLMAVGMTFVIISRGIDLSVGAILAAVIVVGALTFKAGAGILLTVLVCLALGTLMGLVNGVVITKGKIEPFIVTLGMMTVARGVALVVADGRTVIVKIPEAMRFWGNGYLGPIPTPVVVAALVFLVAGYVLRCTTFGRYVYALGGNEEATRLSGINTDFYKISVYVINGFLAGLAGVIYLARLSVGEPTAGSLFELDAIASVVVGGTSFNGGMGGVGLTVIGALIIGLITNILNLLNVSPYAQEIVKGVIIVTAVLASVKRK